MIGKSNTKNVVILAGERLIRRNTDPSFTKAVDITVNAINNFIDDENTPEDVIKSINVTFSAITENLEAAEADKNKIEFYPDKFEQIKDVITKLLIETELNK